MKFQLVFQFPAETLRDFDVLTALEDRLYKELARSADAFVDGHDCGVAEFNIFILTDTPQNVFARVRDLITAHDASLQFRAAYRALQEEDYTIVWPPSATNFSIA